MASIAEVGIVALTGNPNTVSNHSHLDVAGNRDGRGRRHQRNQPRPSIDYSALVSVNAVNQHGIDARTAVRDLARGLAGEPTILNHQHPHVMERRSSLLTFITGKELRLGRRRQIDAGSITPADRIVTGDN